MATLFFDDYEFPSELYNKEARDFTTPIRTLLDFAPHILKQLPQADQKPIPTSEAQESWTKSFVNNKGGYLWSLINSERTKAVTEFIIHCGTEYMRSTSEAKRKEEEYKRVKAEDRKRRRRENQQKWFFNREEVSDSSESESEDDRDQRFHDRLQKEKEDKIRKEKEKESKEFENKQQEEKVKTQAKEQQLRKVDNSTLAKSAVAATALSLSLYSTYQASVEFSNISFHNQLELLISQVQSIIQSTEIWIQEHEKLKDPVPTQVRIDLIYLKQLIDDLVRLDQRSNKKIQVAGWSCGAVGGLGALGGLALGSAAVVTGGAALALGGALVMVSAKAQSNGKSHVGARLLLENQVREKVQECQSKADKRKEVILNEFEKIKVPAKKPTVKNKVEPVKELPSQGTTTFALGDKRKLKHDTKKEKTAVFSS